MFRNIITTAFLVFAYITCNAQSSDGTMLLDDATSQTRVVTNAFLNASNAVHELIQSVSPKADFSTNNAELVVTISATVTNSASGYSDWVITPPSLEGTPIRIESYGSEGSYWMLVWRGSQYAQGYSYSTNLTYQLEGVEINAVREAINTNVLGLAYLSDIKPSLTTNDVCNIVTNASTKWCVEQPSEWELYDTPAFDGMDRWWVRAVLDGNIINDCFSVGNEQSTRLSFYHFNPETWDDEEVFVAVLKTINSLGLARLKEIASIVSNTVTKAYVEDLGIESGVDAQTVTNMTTLAPVYSQTPMFQWTCRIGWDEGDGFTGASWSNDVWSVSFIYYGQAYTMPATVVEGTGAQATKLSFDFDGGTYFATRIRTDIIGYTLGAQTNSILAATNGLITSSITNGLVTASITNGLVTSEITNGLASATITNGLLGADAISTNNAAFVTAVTNCPVVIASAEAEALTEWGIYGGGGTIGALLAALAAAVAALKKKKMPLYPVGGTGNPVNATYESGVLTVSPFAMAAYTPTASAAFGVAMGALPSDMEAGKARDAVLVIDCTSLTEGQEPTVTWGSHFHPRTDAATDLAIVEAGKRAVFYISEYAAGEFAVGGWQETTGGNS